MRSEWRSWGPASVVITPREEMLTFRRRTNFSSWNVSWRSDTLKVCFRIYCEDKNSFLQDCEDDGETAAGGRLLHLLQVIILFNEILPQLHIKPWFWLKMSMILEVVQSKRHKPVLRSYKISLPLASFELRHAYFVFVSRNSFGVAARTVVGKEPSTDSQCIHLKTFVADS